MTDILPPATGERAAMGGYVPQYDEFSRRVYDHILQEDLVEIRVADAGYNVGKLDDICYVTKYDVYAYQLKWTVTGKGFTYADFISLIREVVEGWRKLLRLYPHKTIHTYLITNKDIITANIVRDKKKREIGSFKEYVSDVLDNLHADNHIDSKWNESIANLKNKSSLSSSEWPVFWRTFNLKTGYEIEDIRVENIDKDQRQKDILNINRLIQQFVADRSRKAVYSVQQIINALGWQDRLTTRFNHSLTVPLASYEPIGKAIDELNQQLKNKTKGYVFLEGTPGSGKSTILTQWANSIPNKTIKYYAFDFTNPSSSRNNDWHRGDSTSFLFDMVLMMEHEFDAYGRALPFDDYMQLKNRFYQLLTIVGKSALRTGLPIVIIVDGLDHISREYTECSHTLIKVLPSMTDLPDGVIFVLGSQYFDKLPLSKSLIADYKTGLFTIKMPPFSKKEVAELTRKVLGEGKVSAKLNDECYSKSQGHPLYLRYLLNILKENPEASFNEIASYSGDVEQYYDTLLAEEVVNDAELKHLLALMSRLNGEILLDFVNEWSIPEQTKMDFRKLLFHLFFYDKKTNAIRFFHNSFRHYLLNKTSINNLSGEYDERTDFKYYGELAEYINKSNVQNKWDEGFYLYHAHQYETFVARLTPEVLTRQIHDFRPLWHVVRDVNRGLAIAKKEKNPYLIVRYLLMKSQIDQMSKQDYNGLEIVPELLKVGKVGLAKFLIHSGGELHCNQYFALKLAMDFIAISDITEANILLDMAYPTFLMDDPKERAREYYDIQGLSELAEKWIEVAAYLIPKEKIEEHYHRFANYIKSYSNYHKEEFDEDTFYHKILYAYVGSLIGQQRFDELDNLLKSLDINRNYTASLVYGSYSRAIKQMLILGYDDAKKDSFFEQIVKFCHPDNSRQCLNTALIAYKLKKDLNIIKKYLERVDWNKLGDYHMSSIVDDFNRLKDRILYVDLSTTLGCKINLAELIPDNEKDVDLPLLNTYIKMVLYLAQLRGETRRGNVNNAELLNLAKPYLSFCDAIPFNSHNRYSYAITQQRSDFYKFMFSVVSHFDNRTKEAFVGIVADYFNSKSCKAIPRAKRTLVMELFSMGANKDKCVDLLKKIETTMLDNQDVDGAASELLDQGKAWMALGNVEHAFELFHKMVDETFGVGYRKDYQPSTFMEWIVAANKALPDKALERLMWVAQRLRHIYSGSENDAGREVALALMNEAFRINIGYGVRFIQWMLDKELTSYLDSFETLLRNLLDRVSNEEEYVAIFHLYSDIYLFTDSPIGASPNLLRKVIAVSKSVCPQKKYEVKDYLTRSININSPENNREDLMDVVNGFTPPEKTQSTNKNDDLIAEAEEALKNGEKGKAWKKSIEAIEKSNPSGWIRSYDGGTRINACRMLQKVDKSKGREYTIKLFVEDIIAGSAYEAFRNIDEILPLLTDGIKEDKLFAEEFGYMNRILREDAVCFEDTPTLNSNDMSVLEGIIDWCIYLSNMPIFSIVEQAMILIAHLIDNGNIEIINKLPSDRKKLEIGMYLIELHSNKLIYLRPIAEDNVFADNYLLRIYARKILDAIGIPYKLHQYRRPSPVYKMIFPKSKENLMMTPWHIDTKDPNSVMRYANIITGYLSEFSSISQETLNHRGYMLLLNHIDIELVSDEAEKRFQNHLEAIYLKYRYPQHRAMLVIDAMMEVAAELIDSSSNPKNRFDDSIFMMYDFANINVKTIAKLPFVQRIADKASFYVHKGWTEYPNECIRLKHGIEHLNDGSIVIGEYTRLIKPQIPYLTEEYLSVISNNDKQTERISFFDDTLYQRDISYYYANILYGLDSIVVSRRGYFYMYTLKETWIAFNPFIAKQLGWRHSGKYMFAWEDSNGNLMARSFYWRSGNVQRCWDPNSEMGEGWIVAVSIDAYSLIQKIGYTYLHQMVERQNENEDNTESHSTYKITKL